MDFKEEKFPLLNKLARAVPKCELHLHVEGTLEPELAFDLAKKNNVKLKHATVEELRQAYKFSDLQSFLNIYYECASVLQTSEDFDRLLWAYVIKCKEDNVAHAEVFFDPQTHTKREIPFSVFMPGFKSAIDRAEKELGISISLIMCFLRDLSEEEAFQTFDEALPYLDKKYIVGVGLCSAELGNPPSKFKNVFTKVRELGLHVVSHAGEEGPATYIWEALEILKAERIDHGVRCIDDQSLIDYLVKQKVPLTCCPFSNVRLCVFDSLSKANLKTLLDLGLKVTINSDDPAYFMGYCADNYVGCIEALNLTEDDVVTLARNSIESSFLAEKNKGLLLERLIEVKKTYGKPCTGEN